MQACILIRTLPSNIVKVYDAITQIKAISKSYVVYGRFDIVAFVDDAPIDVIQRLTREINSLQGIKATETVVSG